LQDRGRGLIVGTTSFGKGSVQSVIPLNGGRDGALRLTTARYYTPAGRSIQGTGVDPDIFVSYAPDDGKERKRFGEKDLPNALPKPAYDLNADVSAGLPDILPENETAQVAVAPPQTDILGNSGPDQSGSLAGDIGRAGHKRCANPPRYQ